MGKRLPTTPRSKIRAALRQLWLRSRERAAALKRDGYTCRCCGRKQSRAKGKEFEVQVHHKRGVVNWEQVIDYVQASLLCGPEHLETLCRECHDKTGQGGEPGPEGPQRAESPEAGELAAVENGEGSQS